MTDVWVRVARGTDHPDISNITAAGRAAMDAYDHATDGILKCLIDWGRVNTVSGFPMELIVTEDQVTILYEYNHTVRRVFLDQSEFSSAYPPSLVGYSIGHWEGDTLVAETRNLLSGWLNMDGVAPYTDAAVTTERFTLDPEQPFVLVDLSYELLQDLQCVAKRSFAINPLPVAIDEYFADDLVVEIHDEYPGVGDAVGGLTRFILLV